MATNELWMKFLINTESQKVCLAEAGSDVVEFLTGLLSLPLCTMATLLGKEHNLLSSIGTLLGSVEKLGTNYSSKPRHLSPAVSPATLFHLQQLLGAQQEQLTITNGDTNGNLYGCQGNSVIGNNILYGPCGSTTSNYEPGRGGASCWYLSTVCDVAFLICGSPMSKAMTLVETGNNASTVVMTNTINVHRRRRPVGDPGVRRRAVGHRDVVAVPRQGPQRAAGEDGQDRQGRGAGDTRCCTQVQYRANGRLPAQEERSFQEGS